MAKKRKSRINDTHSYTVQEAMPLLDDLTAETIKKKCREGEIKGTQAGKRKKWHIKGLEIKRVRKLWNLDEIER
jgi:hypothetical protein